MKTLTKTLLTPFLILALLALALPALTTAAASGPAAPELVAVKFHADWCGSCKKMGNVFEDLRNKYDGRPILFVTLDLTNGTTRSQAEYMASALGFGKVFAENQGTGFILLLDGSSRQQLAKLTADQDIKAMGKVILEQLDRS